MSDGKIVIDTDLDSSGIEEGLKKTQKSMKSQAASLAAEYKKQGMTASDAFKKAWSEIERSSTSSSVAVEKDFQEMSNSGEKAADNVEKEWKSSGLSIGNALSKIGSITAKGLKVAATAITGTATAMAGIATAAVKVGSDFEAQARLLNWELILRFQRQKPLRVWKIWRLLVLQHLRSWTLCQEC